MRQGAGWVAGVGVVLSAVGALTSGCTSSGTSAATPTSPHVGTAPGSNTTAPTGSPTTSGPTATPTWNPDWPAIPAKAKKHTPRGAEAFARYYMDALNYAWRKPDSAILQSLSTSGCKSCGNLINTAANLQARGQRYPGNAVVVISSEPVEVKPGAAQDAQLLWRTGEREVVDSSGMVVRRDKRARLVFLFRLNWVSKRWAVAEVYNEKLSG